MALTYSVSKALTFARLELLKLQVKIALRRSSSVKKNDLKAIDKGLDNKWIATIKIYGIDYENLCRAQLSLDIDWNQYEIQLSQGRVTVVIDERWNNNTAIELDEALTLFNKYVQVNNLNTRWAVEYSSYLNVDEINHKLGFVNAEPIRWAGGTFIKGNPNVVPELQELCIGLRLIE